MRTISDALLAAQKGTKKSPYVRASFNYGANTYTFDNGTGTVIDVGNAATDRASLMDALYTVIDIENPANLTGTIDKIEVWAYVNITGLRVGTFYVSGESYVCRASVTIGSVSAGSKQTFAGLNLTVVVGDFIGCYYDSGNIDESVAGGSGILYLAGEHIDPGDSGSYSFEAGWGISLYATGSNKVIQIEHFEEPWGGIGIVRIENNGLLSTLNLKGYKLTLGFGFVTGTGEEYSNVRRLWVLSQRDVSVGGELTTEFLCFDDWQKMAMLGLISAGVKLTGTIVNRELFTFAETIIGSVSGATGDLVTADSTSITVVNVTGTFQAGENAAGASGSCKNIAAPVIDSVAGGGGWDRDTTILSILKSITSGILTDVVLDSDDSGNTVNTYKPLLNVEIGIPIRDIIKQLLQMTSCGGRLRNDDKFHILYLNPNSVADYTYDSVHVFYSDVREQSVIMPNKVIFVDKMPDGSTGASFAGAAQDNYSVDRIGTIPTIEVNETIQTVAEAEARATAWIAQRVAEAHQGTVEVPMNVAQELYDMVQVDDSRANVTVKGRVGRLDHLFDSLKGIYNLRIRLGGVIATPGVLGIDYLSSDIKGLVNATVKRPIDLSYLPIMPSGLLPLTFTMVFTATDNDDLTWTAGTITYADGKTQAIDAGSLNLPDASLRYIYTTYGSTTLLNTTTFGNAVGLEKAIVALVKKSNLASEMCIIVPASGGTLPTIAADTIIVNALSAITANMGLLNAGEIRIGTGTVGVNFTGFRIWSTYLGGYNNNVLQAGISPIDGKFYAGAGSIILDASGIQVVGKYVKFYYSVTSVGSIFANSATQFIVETTVGDLYLIASADQAGIDMSIASWALLPLVTADPTLPADGMIWYDTVTDKFRGRANSVTFDFGTGTGGDLIANQNDVTATRAKNTVYQNASGKVKIVTITIAYSAAGSAAAAYTDPSNPPTTLVAGAYGASTNAITFVVPDTYYYKLTEINTTITIIAWLEWNLEVV